MKKIIAIICAVTMMLTVLTGCGVNRKDLYDVENKDIVLAEIFFTDQENATIDVIDTNAGLQKAEIDAMYDSMKNVSLLDKENLYELEEKMIKFFKEEYDVDVSEKFLNIETYLFDGKDSEHFLMGFHIPGENKVYVNRKIYEDMSEFFAFTWCHEVIHLLGINYKLVNYWGLYETVTEAVTNKLIDWMGYKRNTMSAYAEVSNIGAQLISANPELVSKSLTDESFYLEDEINEILKDASYPVAKLPDDTTIAFQLNAYLVCLIEKNTAYMQIGEYLYYAIQEITTAYCRNFNLTEEMIDYARQHWIFVDFDHTTIRSRNGRFQMMR